MKATIAINMNGEKTFYPGNEAKQLAYILRKAATKLLDGEIVFDNAYDRNLPLRDSDGNLVGALIVTP